MRDLTSVVIAALAASLSLGASCNTSSTKHFDYAAMKKRCQGSFRLESGDVVRVQVWNEPNHSREAVLVRPDGRISLPLVGDIAAADLTIGQLAESVRVRLQAFVPRPRVDVSLVTARSYQVFVMGEVRAPGSFAPPSQVNVLQALSMAGGFTPFAKRDRITIVWQTPQGETRIPFNYDEVLQGLRPEQNLSLCRGDTVMVP